MQGFQRELTSSFSCDSITLLCRPAVSPCQLYTVRLDCGLTTLKVNRPLPQGIFSHSFFFFLCVQLGLLILYSFFPHCWSFQSIFRKLFPCKSSRHWQSHRESLGVSCERPPSIVISSLHFCDSLVKYYSLHQFCGKT